MVAQKQPQPSQGPYIKIRDRLVSEAVSTLNAHPKWNVNEALAVVTNEQHPLFQLWWSILPDAERLKLAQRIKKSRLR